MINKIISIYQQIGLRACAKLFFRKIFINTLAFPVALTFAGVFHWKKIILVRLFSSRIGHYAHNTELLLCALDGRDYTEKFLFYNTPGEPICNKQLYWMWKRVIWILPFPAIFSEADKWLKLILKDVYKNNEIKKIFESASSGGHDKWNYLEKYTKGHLVFTAKEERLGNKLLQDLGIKEGSKFICLLMRDSGYLQHHLPNNDWSYHNYRDVEVNKYQLAAQFLANKGFYVVRMGKQVKDKFDISHPRIIDYATHSLRSDFLDIYLSAHCYFMLSTSCGLDSVAQIFRRPLLITDFPLTELKPYFYWKVFIFKKIFDTKNDKFVSIEEIFQQRELFNDKRAMVKAWQEKGWRFIDNSPEEIVEAVDEMLQRLENNWRDSEENHQLQQCFWKNFPIEFDENQYSYGNVKIRIAESFLKQNQHLLSELSEAEHVQ